MHLAVGVAVLAVMLALPQFIYPVFLMKVLCFALFACAFNLLIGYVGLLSFGHAAYFGGGAYIAAHLIKVGTVYVPFVGTFAFPPVTPEIGILCGTIFAGLLGFVFGSLAIRRQGIYFAMITLALAEMFFLFCVQAPFTHNEDGIQAVPRSPLFGVIDTTNETSLYYIVLAIFLIGFAILYRTVHSPFGQVLKAIRENEPRAISLGYNVERYKLLAFVISCTLAGLAGATKAFVFRLASLTDVTWQMSGEVVLMTLLGGIGTIFGPIAGAALIVSMQNYLATLGEWVLVIQGAIFVACVMLFRRGIVGEIREYFRVRRAGAGRAPVESSASAAHAADKKPATVN
ncbi:MAG: branched-chain amino acid ABC transporter permease [Hyphomicrobiaceae bacterium]